MLEGQLRNWVLVAVFNATEKNRTAEGNVSSSPLGGDIRLFTQVNAASIINK